MLDVTLNTKFVVGTNLRGDLASADWRFLLPRLQFERVLCIGLPKAATLSVLASMCDELLVFAKNQKRLLKVIAEGQQRGAANLRAVCAEGLAHLPCRSGSIDLVFVTRDRSYRALTGQNAWLRECGRLLRPEGVIYYEVAISKHSSAIDETPMVLAEAGLTRPRIFRLTPQRGEMHTAIPFDDGITAGFFRQNLMGNPTLKSRVVRLVDRLRGAQRFGVITQRSGLEANGHLPEYLISIAAAGGKSVDDYRWGMSAAGRRNTRKVLFYLLHREQGKPEAIIKLTRSAAFNVRLENEYRALDYLNKKNIVEAGTFPPPLFFGYHGNLAVLGEGIIHGKAFRQKTSATQSCPLAKAAIEWIFDLGANTADATKVSSQQAAVTLNGLFKQFNEIYTLSEHQHSFFVKQIGAIAQSSSTFPAVFQHGDPGIWNVMATERGGIAFLDWEAAEQCGMPLWDLFYFLRSFGTWVSRRAGMRDSLKSFSQNFLAAADFSRWLSKVVCEYCERVNLDGRLIEPLFYACWMHRALKEATRLTMAKLEKGHYINLLRLCIENRQAPGLVQLFSSNASAA